MAFSNKVKKKKRERQKMIKKTQFCVYRIPAFLSVCVSDVSLVQMKNRNKIA